MESKRRTEKEKGSDPTMKPAANTPTGMPMRYSHTLRGTNEVISLCLKFEQDKKHTAF